MTDPNAPTPERDVERIMELVSVLEDRVTTWARGATPEERSIRADNAHAAQIAVRDAITTALARPATLVVPEGSVTFTVEDVDSLHRIMENDGRADDSDYERLQKLGFRDGL